MCLSLYNIYIYFYFTYPLRCLRVPQVKYHWSKAPAIIALLIFLIACLNPIQAMDSILTVSSFIIELNKSHLAQHANLSNKGPFPTSMFQLLCHFQGGLPIVYILKVLQCLSKYAIGSYGSWIDAKSEFIFWHLEEEHNKEISWLSASHSGNIAYLTVLHFKHEFWNF
jgi:hypothetical protein